MGIFEDLFYENPDKDKKKKSSLFYKEDDSEEEVKKSGKLSSLLFVEEKEKEKPKQSNNKIGRVSFKDMLEDLFYQQDSSDVHTDLISEDAISTSSDEAKIKIIESELNNIAEIFKTVSPQKYPDSSPEYQAYLGLIEQLKKIKELMLVPVGASGKSIPLENAISRFKQDYEHRIGIIKSLCYLSEIDGINIELSDIFNQNFTSDTLKKVEESEKYIEIISKKSSTFDKKYEKRITKSLVEAEYRLTLLKLMGQVQEKKVSRKNPFSSFSAQKKELFETFLSKDITEAIQECKTILFNQKIYTEHGFVKREVFDSLSELADNVSKDVARYTIDDFKISELFENKEGYESLLKFLMMKLKINYIDSKSTDAHNNFADYKMRSGGKNQFKYTNSYNTDLDER